jgi:beta-glucosidase
MSDIEPGAPQHSFGNTSFHMDIDHTPLFPFGYGLSYSEFSYSNISISADRIKPGDRFVISADLTNIGNVEATEVAQLYIRDLIGSTTRPVKQLKRFARYHLKPGETVTVSFDLTTNDLAFFGRLQKLVTEPGEFHAWIGGSSAADLRVEFELIER